ncbi:neuronal acetylcholine receptor subunit alpha-10-like [Branchiostoma floridae x Branchiostoma japonicum]
MCNLGISLGFLLLMTLMTLIPESIAQDAAVALKTSLLANYDKSLRPVKSSSTPVNVDFDVSIRQIIELSEKDQIFRINLWLRVYWNDEYLTWNASEHGGVDSLSIHSSDVWRPDIFLFNNIAETYGNIEAITDVTVTSTGRVTHLQPTIFTSACPVDISRFPFDKQECTLEFGSWIYNAGKLNMSQVKSKADRSTFTPSVEWIVNGAPMKRKVDFYPCCPHPFVTILIILQLERRSFFYMFNMVLPCAILMILNVLGFYIPPESGERLGFFMTILLALVVFLQVLSGSLPKTSTTVPRLGMFFAVTIALVGFSCLASIVVIRLSYSGPAARPLPRWLRLLLLHYLARLFCMDTIAEEKHVDEGKEGVSNSSHQDSQAKQPRNTPNLALDLSLREIVRYSREYLAQTWKKKLEEADQDEWKMAALVLDRALMILVGIASIVACVILLR